MLYSLSVCTEQLLHKGRKDWWEEGKRKLGIEKELEFEEICMDERKEEKWKGEPEERKR